MNLNKDILIGFGVGLVTGGGAGMFIATKQAEARADREIASVKEAFSKLHHETTGKLDKMTEILGEAGYVVEDDGDVVEPVTVSDEKLEELRLRLTEGPPIAEAKVEVTITEPSEEVLNAAYGADKRRIYADQDKLDIDGDDPYVITVDQFQDERVSGPGEHDKQTITYFAGDGVLVDSRDMIIKDTKKTVGDVFDRFGDGSDEEHIVYVRNCWMTVDFEVVREEGTYAAYIARSDEWENEEVKTPVLRMRRD